MEFLQHMLGKTYFLFAKELMLSNNEQANGETLLYTFVPGQEVQS